jgi:hypothetical protein
MATNSTMRVHRRSDGLVRLAVAKSRRDPACYRAYRQRRRQGKACLRLEVDLGELADVLVAGGFLQEWDSADKAAVERATEKLLAVLIAEHGD